MQLLIKAVDSPTLAKYPTMAWRRGDVVGVFSDTHKFGREEKPPTFCIVKLPGNTIDDAADWMVQEHDEYEDRIARKINPLAPRPAPMIQRRQVQFDLEQLESGEQVDASTGLGIVVIQDQSRRLHTFRKNIRKQH